MLILEIGLALLVLTGAGILLKRRSGPTRSVAQVLYETEQPTRDRS